MRWHLVLCSALLLSCSRAAGAKAKKQKKGAARATNAQEEGIAGPAVDALRQAYGVEDDDEDANGFFEEILEGTIPKDVLDGSKAKRMLESWDDLTDEEAWEEVKTFDAEYAKEEL